MKEITVRIQSIELSHFKNVEYGKIEMPNPAPQTAGGGYSADILGIYGQNGSGKTAMIEALYFLKLLLMGKSIPEDAVNYINTGADRAQAEFRFQIRSAGEEVLAVYQFELKRTGGESAELAVERLSYSRIEEGAKRPEKTLVKFEKDVQAYFTPNYRYRELINGDKEGEIKVNVARVITVREKKSFVFSEELKEVWSSRDEIDPMWHFIVPTLMNYGMSDLFVIRCGHSSIINLDYAIPFTLKHEDGGKLYIGSMLISLNSPSVFEVSRYQMFVKILKEVNLVISVLVPGLLIEIKEHGPQMTKEGKEGIRFELMSCRGSSEIPLRYESEGIKKILSILDLLIAVYNNPSVCIAVDELDAGVYEYLLGEMLAVIEETGKGQLLFTSHNLRPLEMIHKNSLVFTTTNPKNRYIRLVNVKNNNNLRDLYLRSIHLGGQKEQIYEPTRDYVIRKAFRRAGRMYNE